MSTLRGGLNPKTPSLRTTSEVYHVPRLSEHGDVIKIERWFCRNRRKLPWQGPPNC